MEIANYIQEAPEKIYLCPSELAGIDYDEEWYDRPFGDSIEYTRTDTFIDKAVQFISQNLTKQTTERLQTKAKFIRQFKEYLEGE